MRALGPEVGMLPVYGVGHSLGATLHLLISARYAVVVRACADAWGMCIKVVRAGLQLFACMLVWCWDEGMRDDAMV